jgi:riboflavin synthase alpha subunit
MRDLDNIMPVLKEYVRIKRQIKALEAELEPIDQQVREAVVEAGSVEVDGYTLTCEIMPGRTTLDKKSLEADGIDLTRYQKTGAPFTQLKMKEV